MKKLLSILLLGLALLSFTACNDNKTTSTEKKCSSDSKCSSDTKKKSTEKKCSSDAKCGEGKCG